LTTPEGTISTYLAENTAPAVKRLALHARTISFLHPFNGRRMKFDTGIPEDFVRMLGQR
jgi:tRNA pseudouridine32 synthase/23S rRNA pseudouridine746 synthase/23S rRNA pseudouridine1911/1915/1917 synthase